MIDYLMKFDTQALALADPVVGAFALEGLWRGDVCLPNVVVWQPSQDVVTSTPDGDLVTHTYLPFWYVTISDEEPNADLLDHNACVLAVDWSVPTLLRSVTPEGTSAADFSVSPLFAGRDPTLLALRT